MNLNESLANSNTHVSFYPFVSQYLRCMREMDFKLMKKLNYPNANAFFNATQSDRFRFVEFIMLTQLTSKIIKWSSKKSFP